MQVFKTYFRILKKYKGTVILYFVIFLSVAVVMATQLQQSSESEKQEFSSEALHLAVVDRDQQTLGKAIKEYFKEKHEFIDVEDDEDIIFNELYWRKLDYVLVIPKGFEKSIADGESLDMDLECMEVPGAYANSYFETELSQYMGRLEGLVGCGYSIREAEEELDSLKGEKTKVELPSNINENKSDITTLFFQYIPYMFISLGIVGVGMVLLLFNKQEVKERMECSSTPLKVRIMGLAGGIFGYGLIMLLVILAVAGVLTKGEVFSDIRTPYFMLNILAILLLGLSLGFFVGTVAKNNDAVNGIVNIASLGLCFMGGVFVPLEFFGEGVLQVAKFIPTYWYVVTNEAIGGMTKMTSSMAKEMIPQIGVEIGYAFVIFAITVVIISSKRRRSE